MFEQFSDKALTRAIRDEFQTDGLVFSKQIDIQTNGGTVHLSGSVPTLQAKEWIQALTEAIRGVKVIENQLKVRPDTFRSDGEIERNIMAALFFDPATNLASLAVKVKDGAATLTGEVESWQKKELCAWVVKGVKGLREIKNEISFVYQQGRPDEEIAQEIKHRLEQDIWVDDALITVEVKAGQATLSGLVSSVADQSRAGDKAWVEGVSKVDTHGLIVEPRTQKAMLRESNDMLKSDEVVQRAIVDAFFYDPRIQVAMPGVQVKGGQVVLTGAVDNLKARQAAEQTALNTIGVSRVENYLQVRPADRLNDHDVAQNVRQALLWSPNVDRHPIVISCREGLIRLDGSVSSHYVKAQAEDVASRTRGVVGIKNNLTIDQRSRWLADETVRQAIECRLHWSAFLEPDQITVTVKEGKAILSGELDTWSQHETVVMKALTSGAKGVVSHINVGKARKS